MAIRAAGIFPVTSIAAITCTPSFSFNFTSNFSSNSNRAASAAG